MENEQQNFQLINQENESVIILKGVLNIYHGKSFKELLLCAIEQGKNITINMADVEQLDLAMMQLLMSTKITAATHGLSVTLSPVSEQAKQFLDSSALSFEFLN